jgi:hypothetical protein
LSEREIKSKLPQRVDRGYGVAERQRGKLIDLGIEERISPYHQSACSQLIQAREHCIEGTCTAGMEKVELHPE